MMVDNLRYIPKLQKRWPQEIATKMQYFRLDVDGNSVSLLPPDIYVRNCLISHMLCTEVCCSKQEWKVKTKTTALKLNRHDFDQS